MRRAFTMMSGSRPRHATARTGKSGYRGVSGGASHRTVSTGGEQYPNGLTIHESRKSPGFEQRFRQFGLNLMRYCFSFRGTISTGPRVHLLPVEHLTTCLSAVIQIPTRLIKFLARQLLDAAFTRDTLAEGQLRRIGRLSQDEVGPFGLH